MSSFGAALLASLAFGLWHVSPTIIGIRINDPHASRHKLWAAVAGAVLLTTVAGLGFTWLRLRTGAWSPRSCCTGESIRWAPLRESLPVGVDS